MAMAPKRFSPAQSGTGKSRAVEDRCRAYRTKRWEHIKHEIRMRDMMQCQHCKCLILDPAESHVDHIVPARSYDDVFCEASNLQLLCHKCHSRKTKQEMQGGGSARSVKRPANRIDP